MVGAAPAVPLKDVEWRLDSEPKDGDRGTRARFVPHINARTAAALMDEWVGPLAWADEYRTVTIAGKEAILCTVSVWDGERWISKQDVGVPSHTEAQKGGISDAFKRTVTVKWGCGRNVYELPTLWAPCKAVTGRDGKTRGYANDQTLPDLLAQLKRLGYDQGSVVIEDEPNEDSGASQGAIPPSREGNRTASAAPEQNAGGSGERPVPPEAGPTPSGGTIGKNKLQGLLARAKALRADDISLAGVAKELHLPKIDEHLSEHDAERWDAAIGDIERALEKPFTEVAS